MYSTSRQLPAIAIAAVAPGARALYQLSCFELVTITWLQTTIVANLISCTSTGKQGIDL